MKFFTKNVKYSILALLAAYGTYTLVFQIIGGILILQRCGEFQDKMISILCHIFG